MNYENKNASETNDITKNINQNFYKKECNDTGNQWKKNCPKCNKEIFYKDQYKLQTALSNNTSCKICARFNKKFVKNTDFYKTCPVCFKTVFYNNLYALQNSVKNNTSCRSCSKSKTNHPRYGIKQSDEEKEKRNLKLKGLKRNKESIKKYSLSKMGDKNPMYGNNKLKTKEHRRKIRLSCINTYKNKIGIDKTLLPRHNPIACKIIDEYGIKNGYIFQHALNGGEFYIKELGYWVDGYDKSKNVVIEYYEKEHNRQKRKEKDDRRMLEIIDFLKCEFIIVYENGDIKICT
jgi:hypothetical protein